DQESRNVEVMQHKQRKTMAAADVIDQLPRRGDGYALGRDDHEVKTVGEVHRLEQRIEAFLFAKEYCADISDWTDDVDVRVGKPCRDDARSLHRLQVIADLNRPAADATVGVRL